MMSVEKYGQAATEEGVPAALSPQIGRKHEVFTDS
jgi:hypothetical protein